jgi:hypothetical protein
MARRHDAELKLRLGEKLRRRIERAAARNNHSMNTEILDRLEGSFAADEGERAGAAQFYRDLEYLRGIRHRVDHLISWLTSEEAGGQQ